MSGWIVGTRTAGDRGSERRCLIPLDQITMIEEGHDGGIVVHIAGQMPEVLVMPGFEEIEERMMTATIYPGTPLEDWAQFAARRDAEIERLRQEVRDNVRREGQRGEGQGA